MMTMGSLFGWFLMGAGALFLGLLLLLVLWRNVGKSLYAEAGDRILMLISMEGEVASRDLYRILQDEGLFPRPRWWEPPRPVAFVVAMRVLESEGQIEGKRRPFWFRDNKFFDTYYTRRWSASGEGDGGEEVWK